MKRSKTLICTINTFDISWDVYLTDPYDSQLQDKDVSYDGLTVNSQHEIIIADNLDEFNQKQVIYHEVCHAFNNAMYGRKENFTHEEMCEFIGRYGNHIHTQADFVLTAIKEGKK